MSDAAWITQINLFDDGVPVPGNTDTGRRVTAVPGGVEPHPRRQRKPVDGHGQEKPGHERNAARAGRADRLGWRRTSRQGW